ncbi:hypothetical protein L1049_001045 [Liquidambar formosana]|uniref:Uncharacterized protein n=1 Tax=Liquidambar formosana TaxID=63359 RepID=A0AAP0NA77_LIQFO
MCIIIIGESNSLVSLSSSFSSPFQINQDKRKASTDNLLQQPPLKKVATDGPMGVVPLNSLPVDIQGAPGGFSTAVGGSTTVLSSMSRQLPNENMPGSGGGRDLGSRVLKTSAVLAQVWKEDTNAGPLLASLFEFFGESMFSFTPTPELSFFL